MVVGEKKMKGFLVDIDNLMLPLQSSISNGHSITAVTERRSREKI